MRLEKHEAGEEARHLFHNEQAQLSRDLRRTAATVAGQLVCSDAGIAKCLDHVASKNQTEVVPTVTTRVYQLSKRTAEKLAVLNAVATEIRAIIAPQPERQLRLVA